MFYLRRNLCLVAVFALGCLSVDAQKSGSSSAPNAGSLSWFFSYNESTSTVTLILNHTGGFDPGWYGGQYVWGVEVGSNKTWSSSGWTGSPGNASVTMTCLQNPGETIELWWNGRHAGTGGADVFTPNTATWIVQGDFKGVFELPANDSDLVRTWYVMQGGQILDTYNQTAHSGAYSWTVSSESSAEMTLYRVTGGRLLYQSGSFFAGPETVGAASGTVTPTTGGTTLPVGTVPVSAPVGGTPNVPIIDAPDDVTAPDAPEGVETDPLPAPPSDPNSPSGSGGATKEDIERQTNQLVQAGHNSSLNVINSVNKVVTAVNASMAAANQNAVKVVEGLNNVTGAVINTGNANVEATNALKDSLEELRADLQIGQNNAVLSDSVRNQKLDTIAQKIDTTNTKLGEIAESLEASSELDEAVLNAQESNPEVSEMESAGGAAKTQVEGLFGAAPSGLGFSEPSGGAPDLTITFPSIFGGATFDFNPFSETRLGPVASWFRAATHWLVLALLGVWIWQQIAEWTRGFSMLQAAKGNAVVAGTGSQATSLVLAGMITVALVAAVTGLLAWSFDAIALATFSGLASVSPLAAIPTGIYWMLDQLFPVMTILTAVVARVTFNMYAAPIFAGASAVIRFFVV